ncbi:hypothetical protein AJ87_20225 [Rhizobium yanglingense]|nr:hypothetical protein AJ87_20225 [Rhizobium yanglingense]
MHGVRGLAAAPRSGAYQKLRPVAFVGGAVCHEFRVVIALFIQRPVKIPFAGLRPGGFCMPQQIDS